jgi:hypothetical protein
MSSSWEELSHHDDEYAVAYDVVRHAMTLVFDSDVCSKLQMLENVLHIASFFVAEELDELAEKAAELGLDKWQQEAKAWEEEHEELEEEEDEQEELT